jgi:hypothetical protein
LSVYVFPFFSLFFVSGPWRPPWRPDYWASRLAPTRLDLSGVFNKINGMRLQSFFFIISFYFFVFVLFSNQVQKDFLIFNSFKNKFLFCVRLAFVYLTLSAGPKKDH